MKISGKHVEAARVLLGLTQRELAAIVGVEMKTISLFESNVTEPHRSNLLKIQTELERRGIEFSNGNGLGVRLNYDKAAEFARQADQAQKEHEH